MAKIVPTIDPEFQAECPAQTEDEKRILREQLIAEGCRDPIDVWNVKGYPILDGHTRFEICNGEGIAYAVRLVDLPDRNAALDWIDRLQMGRRNVSDIHRDVLMGRIYNRQKSGHGGDRKSKSKSDTLIDAAAAVAEEFGKSESTVKRAGVLAEAHDAIIKKAPELQTAVDRGVIPRSNIPGLAKMPASRLKRLAKLDGTELRKASWACPHCGGADRDEDGDCAKCHEPAAKPSSNGKPPKQYDRSFWFKQWEHSIGPLVRLVDKIASGVGEKQGQHHKAVQELLNDATKEMMKWMRAKK